MTNWKFTNASNKVVSRTLESGAVESCLVEAIADWIAAGNTPESADVAPEPTKDQRISEKLATRGLTLESEWLLEQGMATMLLAATVQGVTEAQLYAGNPGYRYAKDLHAEIASIRAEP